MLISPKYDEFIREMFYNETVRRYFVGDILKIPQEEIRSVRLRGPFLRKLFHRQKQGILDVKMELNDSQKINVELQVKVVRRWDKRQLFYLSKLYTEDFSAGEDYKQLKKCVGISILDFNLTDRSRYHSVYRLRDEDGYEFTDMLEIHVIELKKTLTGEGEVDDWIRFFNVKTEEDLKMIKTKNPGILEAIRILRRMSLSNPLRFWYEEHLKEVRDRRAIEAYMREEAEEKGRAAGIEKGRAEGIEKGRAEGIEKGRAEGREEGKAEGRAEGRVEGKAEGVVEGEQKLSELIKYLLDDNRLEDARLAAEDAAVRKRLYEEYGIDRKLPLQNK